MKFGVREICDVVLKAKSRMEVGNKTFYKGEPVIYFDTLKSSGLEGSSSTTYATGGRGNARLMAWEGEKTLTFTMEDALISPVGLMILSGAGLVEGTESKKLPVHIHEQTDGIYLNTSDSSVYIITKEVPSAAAEAKISYVMAMKDGEIVSEPFQAVQVQEFTPTSSIKGWSSLKSDEQTMITKAGEEKRILEIKAANTEGYEVPNLKYYFVGKANDPKIDACTVVMVDYYTDKGVGASQVEITPDAFGGNFYLEASTLFRNTAGTDMPAEFIIPNCKVQSNFNFQMSSSGDPSTFTFTMDAFPDYTKFDETHKVLAAIQIIETAKTEKDVDRKKTNHDSKIDGASDLVGA